MNAEKTIERRQLTSARQALLWLGQHGMMTTNAVTIPSTAVLAHRAIDSFRISFCVEASLVTSKANEHFARKFDTIRKAWMARKSFPMSATIIHWYSAVILLRSAPSVHPQ